MSEQEWGETESWITFLGWCSRIGVSLGRGIQLLEKDRDEARKQYDDLRIRVAESISCHCVEESIKERIAYDRAAERGDES